MKKLTLYHVDAFTKKKFSGNPAGVVANADGLSTAQMQQIAREMNLSETAFIFKPGSSDHDLEIRFFTPTMEVPLCGHATIASHFVLAMEENVTSHIIRRQKSNVGIIPVETIVKENNFQIVMTQRKPFFEAVKEKDSAAILAALHLQNNDLTPHTPIEIVSTGHSKVMICIRSKQVLNSLTPNFQKLMEISNVIGCNGYYVFTLDSDEPEILAHGRMFAPAVGINEDPVTGNANGPLGAYLVKNSLVSQDGGPLTFQARQGEAMGRPGIVKVMVNIENHLPVKVKIAGYAVLIFKTHIEL